MSKFELDILLLGQIMAFTCTDDVTKTSSSHSSKVRKAPHPQGKKICWKTFAYLHGIGSQTTATFNTVYINLPNLQVKTNSLALGGI